MVRLDRLKDRGWKIENRKILSSIIDSLASTLTDMAPCMIRAAHQRTGLHMAKAEFFGFGFEFVELVRRHITFDSQLAVGRLQVLSDGDDVDVLISQVMQRRHDLVGSLAHSEHETRFGQYI